MVKKGIGAKWHLTFNLIKWITRVSYLNLELFYLLGPIFQQVPHSHY